MASISLPAFRLSKHRRRFAIVAGSCALLYAVAAGAFLGGSSSDSSPAIDAASDSTRMIRIKRLRPADPESREIMLADRGVSIAGSSSLS